MLLGKVSQLWRYPVKSLGGEAMECARLTHSGLVGDRHWAIYDPQAPVIRSAKQWPALLSMQARYLSAPGDGDYHPRVAAVNLTAADGTQCASDNHHLTAWLSRQLGHPAQLRAREPAANLDFYRLPTARSTEDIAAELGLSANDSLPDFSIDSTELANALATCATPPGALYDAYPLHVLTQDSLHYIEQASGLNTDCRRFRPNLLLETAHPSPRLTEQEWLGASLAIGEALIHIHTPTLRCSMPGREQAGFGLAAQPALPRAIAQLAGRNLGVNARVLRPGTVTVGDPVYLTQGDP